METTDFTRQTAVKINIASIKQANFVEDKEYGLNSIMTNYGRLYRVNVIGILISKNIEESSFLLDDGTGTIPVNFNFSNEKDILKFQNINQGNCVMIIGKPRKYNDMPYILPEIIKEFDNMKWMKLRKLELETQDKENFKVNKDEETSSHQQNNNIEQVTSNIEKNSNNTIKSEKEEEIKDTYEIVHSIIDSRDNGDGVNFDFIVRELEKMNVNRSETVVKKLLERGELFEITPGMIKLL